MVREEEVEAKACRRTALGEIFVLFSIGGERDFEKDEIHLHECCWSVGGSTHSKAPGPESNLQPFSCEATALTTAPPCNVTLLWSPTSLPILTSDP